MAAKLLRTYALFLFVMILQAVCHAQGAMPAYASLLNLRISEGTSETLLQKMLPLYGEQDQVAEYVTILRAPTSPDSKAWASQRLGEPYRVETLELAVAVAVAFSNPDLQVPKLQDSQAHNMAGWLHQIVNAKAFPLAKVTDPVTAEYSKGLETSLSDEQTSALKEVLYKIHVKDPSVTSATAAHVLLLTEIYSHQTGDATAYKWLANDVPLYKDLIFVGLASANSEPLIQYGIEMCQDVAASTNAGHLESACLFLQAQSENPQVREYIQSLVKTNPGSFYSKLDALTYALVIGRNDQHSPDLLTGGDLNKWKNVVRDLSTLLGQ